MLQLYITWTEIKNIATQNNIQIQYCENDDLYKVYVTYEQNMYIVELWINTDKIKGIDINQNNIDRQDFEDNYKDNSQGAYSQASIPNIGGQTVEATLQTKKSYKCASIDIEASEQEYDLEAIYTEFTLMNTGSEKVIVKLNDSSNDEIPLEGGQNIRDIIGSDTFELSKIYHKTEASGKVSTLMLWATKR